MTPQALLESARQMAGHPALPAGTSLRAASLLARQALEHAMAEVLSAQGVKCRWVSFSVQLVCLRDLTPDPRIASDAAYVWNALSHVCHYQGDELPPDPVEVGNWLETVGTVVGALGRCDRATAAANGG